VSPIHFINDGRVTNFLVLSYKVFVLFGIDKMQDILDLTLRTIQEEEQLTSFLLSLCLSLELSFCPYLSAYLRFQVLTAASMKMAVFWVVAPCSLVEVYRRFRGACCLIDLMIKTVSIYETSVNFYQTTRQQPRRQSLSTYLSLSFC
jgi:hypothetical protein